MKSVESVTVTVNPFKCIKTVSCDLQSQPPNNLMTTDGVADSLDVDDDYATKAKENIDKEFDDTDDPKADRHNSTINLSDSSSSASSYTSSSPLSETKSKSIEMITITDNSEQHDDDNYPTDNNIFETSIQSSKSAPPFQLPLVCDPFSSANTIDDCFRQIAAASVAISKLQAKFRCTQCGLKFIDYSQLVTHLQLDHDNQDLFACLICNTKMTYLTSLQKHVKEMHGIIWKNYIRSYGSKSQAKSPKEASHNYQCDQCEKTFSCYRSVKVHKHYSHNPVMSQEALCAICAKRLKNVFSLRIHVGRVHKIKFANYQKDYL